MSLLRLLATGKSWVGMDDLSARYRVSDPRGLPKFGGKKNPFRVTTRPEREELPNAKPQALERSGTVEVGGADSSPQSQPKPGAMSATSVPPRGRGQGWLGRLVAKIGAWFTRAPRPAKPAIPQFAKLPAQGELSLDSVRVMRNDLTDADLEVVPAKPPVAKRSAAAEQPTPRLAAHQREQELEPAEARADGEQ